MMSFPFRLPEYRIDFRRLSPGNKRTSGKPTMFTESGQSFAHPSASNLQLDLTMNRKTTHDLHLQTCSRIIVAKRLNQRIPRGPKLDAAPAMFRAEQNQDVLVIAALHHLRLKIL